MRDAGGTVSLLVLDDRRLVLFTLRGVSEAALYLSVLNADRDILLYFRVVDSRVHHYDED